MEPVTLYDMEAMSKLAISHDLWDYVAGGATDEITLRRNREAFDEIRLNPRFLVDVNGSDVSTTVLGKKISFPVMAAPTGGQWEAHPDGELAVARACGAAGTLMGLATGSSQTVEDIAAATSGPVWFQLYHVDDRVTEYVVPKAEAAGLSGLCLTVDAFWARPKERDLRNDYVPAPERAFADLRDRPDLMDAVHSRPRDRYVGLTWSRLEWLNSLSDMPLIVKGILTVEDALLCVEHGVDGIVVSNHGGRTLDTVPATIEVLPAIAEAVGDRAEIYLDSGVRRGTDVVKALALGARAVMVGRPLFWGIGLDGEKGVRTMFEILRREFDTAMTFCGARTVGEFDASLVTTP